MRTALIKRKILNTGALWISYFKLLPWLFRLNKNSVIIDCGANTGQISSFLSITGATIYAFEPDPIAFESLQKNCGKRKNINCINKGVWNKNTMLKLFRHTEMRNNEQAFTVGSSIVDTKKNINPASFVEVEVINLIEFIQSLNLKVDLVKIDVEGAETEILQSIIHQDAHRLFKTMYVETHETKIPGQEEYLKKIELLMKQKGIGNIKLNWI
ncbi:MAG: FkbM family methyltransferase [Bacteroidetes bacterium]|nr:MAG: FkbM family methyltransferase [Bacteroidota bacterium]